MPLSYDTSSADAIPDAPITSGSAAAPATMKRMMLRMVEPPGCRVVPCEDIVTGADLPPPGCDRIV
ncbi:hypothetical protein GCM10009634_02200 [Saccharothrix xinjiangensis]